MNEAEIKQLDADIAHLKFAFDQYFMGLERQAPMDEYEALGKRVRNATTTQINNTALRFQRNNIVSKFNSYQAYWNRILKQIEEGTYKRDRLRAAKIAQKPAQAAATTAAAAQQVAAAAPAPSAAGKDLSPVAGDHLRYVYDQYQQALGSLGQQSKLTYGALSTALNKQAAAIKAKYGCSDVQFRVAVENGKAQIKAVPVK